MKILNGLVISDKMQKTAVVAVERLVAHPLYKKRVKRTQKFHAHNEIGAKAGDQVKIGETSKFSKTAAWKIVEVLKHGTT